MLEIFIDINRQTFIYMNIFYFQNRFSPAIYNLAKMEPTVAMTTLTFRNINVTAKSGAPVKTVKVIIFR